MKRLKHALESSLEQLEMVEGELAGLADEMGPLEVMVDTCRAATSIDAAMTVMGLERDQLLRDETRAQESHCLGQLIQYGLYGVACIFRKRRWSWEEANTVVKGEQPFGDVRIGLRDNEVKAIAVSAVARGRQVPVSEAVAMLQKEGWLLLTWDEFLALGGETKERMLEGKLQIGQGQERQALEAGKQASGGQDGKRDSTTQFLPYGLKVGSLGSHRPHASLESAP